MYLWFNDVPMLPPPSSYDKNYGNQFLNNQFSLNDPVFMPDDDISFFCIKKTRCQIQNHLPNLTAAPNDVS